MTLTKEELRTKLGFQTQEEYIKISKENGVYPRRSGRTVELMLEALYQSQFDEVTYLGAYTTYTNFCQRALKQWAVVCGLDPEQIKFLQGTNGDHPGEMLRGTKTIIFRDHHYLREFN
ncbi:hypothetical protein ACQ4M3_09720 [Leptolyngbya sp. AN03gr2]|uniref:hypothetical protein n=1 Tax=Leptolyngbya sp. AN03gr2 TaxID=3423364 RepID=UPI003D31FD81